MNRIPIPFDLIEDLQNKLNLCVRKKSSKSFYEATERLEKLKNNYQKIDSNHKDDQLIDTALILRSILFPFAVKAIEFKSDIISQKMISFILWWIKKKPDRAPNKQIFEVLAEKRVYKLEYLKAKDCLINRHRLFTEEVLKPTGDYIYINIDYIFSLFEIKVFGEDCDDLIRLIIWLINEKVEGKKLEVFFNTDISELWLLFFDPLYVEQVHRVDLNEVDLNDLNEVIGKQDIYNLKENIKLPVTVYWTDNRSDEISNKHYRRQRVDEIVYLLFDVSIDKNCLELMKSIPHGKILKTIETCTNELLKTSRKAFLSKQLIFFTKKMCSLKESDGVSQKSKSLFNHILDVLTSNYKSLLNSNEFVASIIDVAIKFSTLFQNDSMNAFLHQFGSVLTESRIVEIIDSIFDKLLTKLNDQDLINLLQLANMSFDELSKRLFQHTTLTFSLEWLKFNFEQIVDSIEGQEVIYKVMKQLFCVMPSVTFLKLINLYLESNNPLYVYCLSNCVTVPSLKSVRENFDEENFNSLNEAIIKLTDAFNLNEESEHLSESLQFLISFLLSCSSKIRENSSLRKKFYEKSFVDLLLVMIKFKEIKSFSLKISIFNFILNAISDESFSKVNEVVEQIINDIEIYGGLFNEENLFLFLNLLKSKPEFLQQFLGRIINLIEANETNAQKFFASLLKCFEKLSEELIFLIHNKLKEHVGKFIDLLSQKDSKKIAIKFLCKLLNFNEEEKRIMNLNYGLQERNRAESEESLEKNEKYLFFTTENLENKKKRIVKNNADEVTQADIDAATTILDENLKTLKDQSQLKIKLFKNIGEFEKVANSLNFVLTETTISNLNRLLQPEVSPILLKGDTGIGKSATIQVAAYIRGKKLIRFNMSSQVTVDDLLGKVTIVKNVMTNEDTFEFQLSPFAIAFKEGNWLLLDEMNLAPDNVLQCIENALDSKTLILHNPYDSTKPVETITMDQNFRLFATQNPSVGFFKGKREKLSQSLLDRFTVYYFDELPTNEWIEIAKKHLDKSFTEYEANTLSERIVNNIHMNIKRIINEKEFQEKEAYAEITIRDLFKLCERLVFLKNNKIYSDNLLSFCSFLTYGARFRGSGRSAIISFLTKDRLISLDVDEKYDITDSKVTIGELILKSYANDTNQRLATSKLGGSRYIYSKRILLVHRKVKKECFSKIFISEHGLYLIDDSWIDEWFHQLETEKNKENWPKIGFDIYASKFRHQVIREKIQSIFNEEFKLKFDLTEINKNIAFTSILPFAVTERVLKVWKQIGWNLNSSYPILLSGSEGCGKSETIYTLAKLIGMEVTQICLTPETEVSHLVGQYNPNDGTYTDEKIVWQDGFITRAFKKGSSVLLDNLNQGDSCVLERLNPLLENEPVWVLTENRETEPLKKKDTFKVFATMTVSNNSNNKNFYPELSPSFYNRFSIIHMDNSSLNEKYSFRKEIYLIAKCLLDTHQSSESCLNLIYNILWLIHNEINLSSKKSEYGVITMRNYIRFIDMFYKLYMKNASKGIRFQAILFKCYKICFEGQFKFRMQNNESSKQSILYKEIRNQLGITANDEFYLKNNYKFDETYVLTDTRTEFVETMLACIECNIPVLLEGKYFIDF